MKRDIKLAEIVVNRNVGKEIKVGDVVTRMLAGSIPLKVIVGQIKDGIIKVGSEDGEISWEEGWSFKQTTLCEIDEDLGWDGETVTGSYLII
jgi:hypothetical protein